MKKGVPVSTPFSPLSSLRLHQLTLNPYLIERQDQSELPSGDHLKGRCLSGCPRWNGLPHSNGCRHREGCLRSNGYRLLLRRNVPQRNGRRRSSARYANRRCTRLGCRRSLGYRHSSECCANRRCSRRDYHHSSDHLHSWAIRASPRYKGRCPVYCEIRYNLANRSLESRGSLRSCRCHSRLTTAAAPPAASD